MLDLYQRRFEGRQLGPDEYVLCADEKTSIQARQRLHPRVAAGLGRPALVEHEYERRGALAYLAGLDVHQPRLIGRCEQKSGIAPFDRLVEQLMGEAPYCCAERVFWIVDNGSAHRGQKSALTEDERIGVLRNSTWPLCPAPNTRDHLRRPGGGNGRSTAS